MNINNRADLSKTIYIYTHLHILLLSTYSFHYRDIVIRMKILLVWYYNNRRTMLCRYTAAAAVAIYRAKSVSARNEAIPSGSDGVTEPLSVHVEFPSRERPLLLLLFRPAVYARFPYPPPPPPPHRPGRVILMRTRTCNPTEPNGGRRGTLILRLTVFSTPVYALQ